MPVIILSDEIIGHMREAIEIPAKGELEIIDRLKPVCSAEDYKPYDNSQPVSPLSDCLAELLINC